MQLEVEFVVETDDPKVKDRSNDIYNKITIRGLIKPSTTAEVKKLAEWSISNDYKQQYRKVDIAYAATGHSNKMLREFKLTKAFCVDYKEIYPSGHRIEFSSRIISTQDTTGIFPSNGRSGFHLCPAQFAIHSFARPCGSEIFYRTELVSGRCRRQRRSI